MKLRRVRVQRRPGTPDDSGAVPRRHRRRGPIWVGSGALACAAGLLAASPAGASISQPRVASQVPSSATPHAIDDATVSNAAVNTFTQVGSVMYAGGEFRTVQNPGRTQSYTRYNLFSFDTTTGTPTSWTPKVNGEVFRTLATGGFLYVGGYFTSADGVSGRLVRYDLSTLKIDTTWKPTGINGSVTDMQLVNGRLLVSGTFTKKLIALNPATGADTGYLDLGISGTVASNAGSTEVYRFAASPDGTRLVGIGNFTSVSGKRRYRVFMANLGSSAGTLSPWYYQPFENRCAASSLPDYVRDVDFDPTGSYFVIVSTGYVPLTGGIGRDVCDAAARFETATLTPLRPTWINYTGGDTLHSVAAVGSVVYVGGHQRWLNNPYGRDSAGAGAVSRPGVGAIDPATGKALSWNPTKTRGVGLKFIYPTSTGVWFGSDGRRFAGAVHDSIAFTPLP